MHYPIQNVADIIDLCWLAFLVYWIFKATGNKKDIYKRKNVLARILLGILILAAFIFASKHITDLPIIPYTRLTQIIGAVLCAFGVGWAIWARKVISVNWSAYPTVKENHELVQAGPYAITRHPIYTGVILAFLGTFLAVLPTWVGIGYLLIGIIAFSLRVPKEERLMTQTFPNEYPNYKQRVRWALVPFIF